MERYTVYYYDLSKEYNNAGADDEVIVEIESITEDDLTKITNMVNKNSELEKLNKLLKKLKGIDIEIIEQYAKYLNVEF